jgi:peptidoglycan/LPS O-acetylase OafA/YrhL
VRQLALWSYALYLTHLPIMRVIYKLDLAPSMLFGCLVAVVFACFRSHRRALVYRGFETPILAARGGCRGGRTCDG